jgi:hypothetical protein
MTIPTDQPLALDPASDAALDLLHHGGAAAPVGGPDRPGGPLLELATVWAGALIAVEHLGQGYGVRALGPEAEPARAGPAARAAAEGPHLAEDGAGCLATLRVGWAGFVEAGGRRRSLSQLVAEGGARPAGPGLLSLALAPGELLCVDVDGVITAARLVPRGPKTAAGRWGAVDLPFLGALTFMGGLFLGLSTLFAFAPPPPAPAVVEVPDRVATLLRMAPTPSPVPAARRPDSPAAAEEGARAKGAEGRAGERAAKMDRAQGPRGPSARRQRDAEIAAQAGVLGVLADSGGALEGMSSAALRPELTRGVGRALGAKGVPRGAGGLGARGADLGGGGVAERGGGLGTRGRGGDEASYGASGGDFGPRGEGAITRAAGEAVVLGALDKSLIEQVIKRNLNSIRYCYSRELSRSPTLGGKLTVKFTIASDGSVAKAETRQGIGSPAVESCVAERFLRFKFPTPKGGGVVVVSYPFVFSPG